MAADRLEKLRRLLAGNIPFPETGRGFLVNTGLGFLVGEGLSALGADRLRVVERDLVSARNLTASYPDLKVEHTAFARPGEGDLVILPVDKNRQRIQEDLVHLAAAVGINGRLALYGGKKEGITPTLKFLGGFCELMPPVTRGGLRLVLARPSGSLPVIEENGHYMAEARGRRVKVARRPGVFSWEALDPATALLLEGCLPRDGEHLLDLGCGAGVVAAIMLDEGKVSSAALSDSDALALDAAQETLALNGMRGELLAADAGDDLPEKSYDLILCNPPFHRGFRSDRGALERMIARAARLLAPKGRLYIVGPHTLGLAGHLEAQFRRVDALPASPAIELWRAGRPKRQVPA